MHQFDYAAVYHLPPGVIEIVGVSQLPHESDPIHSPHSQYAH